MALSQMLLMICNGVDERLILETARARPSRTGKLTMADKTDDPTEMFQRLWSEQAAALQQMLSPLMPGFVPPGLDPQEMAGWLESSRKLQGLWLEFQQELVSEGKDPHPFADVTKWLDYLEMFYEQLPLGNADTRQRLCDEGLALWENVLAQYGLGPNADTGSTPALPLSDRRFADPRWQNQPAFAILHQTYLMLSDQVQAAIDAMEGLNDEKRDQLRFAARCMVEALSPANFPTTNPVVIERTLETRGENLVRGMEHLLSDLRRGQLSHTDKSAFEVGRNIAVTPGKVVHETPLFQLIQYSPATETVLETPLVIFPPWINRFYILDLNAKKSFVRWAVEQGLTTFMVSWKSADASMAEIEWDDYIRAQIEAIDVVRDRLKVLAVHAIGYCVAGTTLAATLSILARRGLADKVASATFFTAQVDFEKSGELKYFCDGPALTLADRLSEKGCLDGRYMAATFNALRGKDLIWSYVINNYLLGEDYPAFDLLFWNGDSTNLPARWHRNYARQLYRDNLMVVPDRLEADGTPIDLTRIETPCFIQAGREDHIAPPESVFRATRHFRGPTRFMLAGSGHIAGVVNPPSLHKYQYWTSEPPYTTYEDFVAGANEHPGSWWPYWIEWLHSFGTETVPAKGKRAPGGKGDKVIEDAPGRYVMEH